MEAFDRIARERERINALHDVIGILAAELCPYDGSLRDAVIDRLQDEGRKARIAYPADDRGVQHPWPAELATLWETIKRFARKPPVLPQPDGVAASAVRSVLPARTP
jgi:hypothetical protein